MIARTHLIFAGVFLLVVVLVGLRLPGGVAVAVDQAAGQPVPSAQSPSESSPSEHQIFQTISAAEAKDMIEHRQDLILVDVRTPEERKQLRVDGSILLPVGDVIRGRIDIKPEQPVLLLCAVGGRSFVAGKALSLRGYKEVYNLDGGIEAWRRAGYHLLTGPE